MINVAKCLLVVSFFRKYHYLWLLLVLWVGCIFANVERVIYVVCYKLDKQQFEIRFSMLLNVY